MTLSWSTSSKYVIAHEKPKLWIIAMWLWLGCDSQLTMRQIADMGAYVKLYVEYVGDDKLLSVRNTF